MSWSIYHSQSENYVSQAEQSSQQQESVLAIKFYALAAAAEVVALKCLEPSKTRTIGITAISAVSLYLQAQAPDRAKQIAEEYLATKLLPSFAIQELLHMLHIIQQTTGERF
jgi:hypothetical protein